MARVDHLTDTKKSLILVALALSVGCASTPEKSNAADPYEAFNRPVHHFNDKLDKYVAKPVSDTYKFITPDFMETGVRNFFSNLQDVGVVINDVLQAKFDQSSQDLARLMMNTTLGLGGVFDVATNVGLSKNNEDFGQTLAVWGVPQGHYLVLPFVGPATFRDLPGFVVDTALNPSTYVGGFALPISSLGVINSRANAEGSLRFINEAALDPYVFMRESYLQWRNYQVSDGKSNPSSTIDLEADLFDEQDSKTSEKAASPKTAEATAIEVKTPKSSSEQPPSDQQQKSSYHQARESFLEADKKLRALQNK